MPAVDAQLFDQQAWECLGHLRMGFGDHDLKLVGEGGEIGRGGRVSGLVGRLERELGFLRAEVVEPRLKAREPGFTDFA